MSKIALLKPYLPTFEYKLNTNLKFITMSFQLTKTTIKVEGTEGNILFTNLHIQQELADVNSFSFHWRQKEGEAKLSDHVDFYKKNLSKVVQVNVNNDFVFKGLIYSINCSNQDALGVEYEITGKGLYVQMDEVKECNSFIKKPITAIFNEINSVKGAPLKLQPNNKDSLFYTVQYNQTNFEFFCMMAKRYGEWLYYTGSEMRLGKPSGEAITVKADQDVFDVQIQAKLVKSSPQLSGFDHFKGEKILDKENGSPKASGFLEAALKGSDTAFGKSQEKSHVAHAATADMMKSMTKLLQQAAVASSVTIQAQSHHSKLNLGAKIKLLDEKERSAGEYIITSVSHKCLTPTSYENSFTAVPAEIEVPPYTTPLVFPQSKPQPAIVTDNVDKDGLDRVKVRFPWQKDNQNTPWISVLTPHAGKGKGIRFLPEVGEEVMVDFVDNNAERPFVMGSVHTEKNKSGNDVTANNLKIIGTRTARRIEFDDDKGIILIRDFDGEDKGNSLKFLNNKDNTLINMSSGKDAKNFTSFQLIDEQLAFIGVRKNDEFILEIKLDTKSKTIKIKSKGSISLSADQSISLSAGSININASQELTMEGKSKGTTIKGQKVTVEATTDVEVKGVNATVKGTAKLDLSASGVTNLKGGLVNIN